MADIRPATRVAVAGLGAIGTDVVKALDLFSRMLDELN